MQTKFNTGDPVMVPGTIVSARQKDGGIVYEVETSWNIPENYIQEDDRGFGASMRAFAESLPIRER